MDQEPNQIEMKEITSNKEFESAIKNGVTLVDFNAPWCAPCHAQEPIIKKLANQLESRALVTAINIDEHQNLARTLGIQSIPTLIIFKNSKEIQRFVGLQPQDILLKAIENILD
jgi:thioredoxin